MLKGTRFAACVNVVCAALVGVLIGLAPAHAQPKLAKIITVESAGTAGERVFFGRVKARQTIDFAFQVPGQIVELPLDEGQPIQRGDLIARLDLEPFELSLARAQAQFKQATDDFDRLSRLSGSTVSQVSIDDAATAAELAEIAVRDAERSLRLATLTAPFDGIVARRSVPNFSTISSGTPVVRLHDMSDLRVEIDVPEVLFQRAGQDPNVVLQVEFPASPKRFDLEFREVTAETSQVGQSFRITLGMTPPDDLFLLPGASATVYTQLLDETAPMLIPGGALVFDAAGAPAVMVFEPAGGETGTVRRQPVEVAPDRSGAIQVLSGLEAGTDIVAAGAALLEDGESVERFSGFSR
ncbi:MAG: efflux RND transporter periplasmic adaptor subunit [Pseudomonadota bacterium]